MRFLSAAAFSLLFSTSAFAAVTAQDWQNELQSEIQRLSAASPDFQAMGGVAVQEVNGQLRATLPALVVTSPDKSSWQIPSIIMTGSASSDSVNITLPSTITRYNAAKAAIATMRLGAQTLNGSWNQSDNYFNSLNGNIKDVSFSDTIAKSSTQVGNIAIAASKGSSVQFSASDVRNTTTNKEQQTLSSAIGKVNIAYQLPETNKLTLTRLIGLFNPAILLAENQKIGITVTTEQAGMTDGKGRTTTAEKVISAWQLEPKGTIIAASTNTQAFIVRQTPESPYSFVLPQKLDLTATIASLPHELVSFAPGMSYTMAKAAMAKAGTTINLTNLKITTFDQGVLTGKGSVKADNNVPSGFVGRVNLSIKELKQLVNTMQMQLLQPDSGTKRAAKTQSLMAMMLLQGMGKQNGSDTEFVVDLTSEGQTLVNGQDLSGLLPGAKGANSVPSVPVTPVTGSNL